MKTDSETVVVRGVEMEVEFDYSPPCRGSRDKYGVPLEPDEPESLGLTAVVVGGIDIIDLINAKLSDEIISAIESARTE